MLKKLVFVVSVLAWCSVGHCADTEQNYKGVWLTVGCNPKYKTDGVSSGCGGGLSVRGGKYWGVTLAYIDNESFRQSNISIIPVSYAQNNLKSLGYKRVGGEYGFDIDLYPINVSNFLSIRVSPGLYYQGTQEVVVETVNGHDSKMGFGGNKKMRYIPSYGGGVQFVISHVSLDLGWHSERGYTVGLGGRW